MCVIYKIIHESHYHSINILVSLCSALLNITKYFTIPMYKGFKTFCKCISMSSKPRTGKPKSVFAHFIVRRIPSLWRYHAHQFLFQLGNAANYTTTEWILDISEAQAAGIDGFMLNMGVTDPCNGTQLAMAYSTAEQLGYKLAISFDYLAPGPWQVSSVIAIIKQYCDSPAQFRYDGLPLVSTFEGASNAADWAEIGATVPIFFVPTWTSVGPFSPSFQYADGACA